MAERVHEWAGSSQGGAGVRFDGLVVYFRNPRSPHAALFQPVMNPLEDKSPGGGTEQVGQPVVGVVAAAARRETLVPLVEPAGQRDDDDRAGEDRLPVRAIRPQPEKIRAEQTAAAEKVAEVRQLVEMIHPRPQFPPDRERGEHPQNGEPEQESGEPELRLPGKPRHFQSLRISSSIRSASHCFIIDW